METSKIILWSSVIVIVIALCIVIAILTAKGTSSVNSSSTVYTLSCLNIPATRSIQFSGPFYIKTDSVGVGYYTLNFYNAFGLKLLTQVYASGPSPRYFVPPVGATYFEYTFSCS